jgi:hypothetical protein
MLMTLLGTAGAFYDLVYLPCQAESDLVQKLLATFNSVANIDASKQYMIDFRLLTGPERRS